MATYSANTQYEYTNQIFGSFSGGTWQPEYGNVPHPISYKQNSDLSYTGDTVIQMDAVTLGGFNGLNN